MSRTILSTLVLVAVVGLARSPAWSAPCVTACKNEIAACVTAECQGKTHRARLRCKHTCAKTLVHDCYADLTVCGATTARPPQRKGSGSPPGGGW
jgi:hypothetical protein